MHELHHAYEDGKKQSKGLEGIRDRIMRVGYSKALRNYNNKSELISKLSKAFVRLQGFEVNAYISSLRGQVMDFEYGFDSPKEIYEFVTNSWVYKNYVEVSNFISELENTESKQIQGLVMMYANALVNLDFYSFDKLVRYLRQRCDYAFKKLDTFARKVSYDYFQDEEKYNIDL